MIPRGRFLVSLDCEGKWGQADKLTGERAARLTRQKLMDSYRFLVDTLGRFSIPATFAFVEVFTFSDEDRATCADLLRPTHPSLRSWFRAYEADAREGVTDGWFLPEAEDLVSEAGIHEIASHGFSHFPISASSGRDGSAAEEFALLRASLERRGRRPRTFIYPRNIVNVVDLVEAAGFQAYREGYPSPPGRIGGARNLLRELNVFDTSQRPTLAATPTRIPAGYFLNNFAGLRGLVPISVLTRRWAAILSHAARSGGVAHLWLHPHNLIESQRTRKAFATVLEIASGLAAQGQLEVGTLADYCSGGLAAAPRRGEQLPGATIDCRGEGAPGNRS